MLAKSLRRARAAVLALLIGGSGLAACSSHHADRAGEPPGAAALPPRAGSGLPSALPNVQDAAVHADDAPPPRGARADASIGEVPVVRHVPPPPDAPLTPPECGGELSPGQTRVVVEGVIGRVAIDEAGTVYAPTATAGGELALSALDPCGQPIWQRVVAAELPDEPVVARMPQLNEVVLESLAGSRTEAYYWRFDRGGAPLAPLAMQGRAYGWIAATQAGLFLSTFDAGKSFLTQLLPDGRERRSEALAVARDQTIPTGEDECAAYGMWLGCHSLTFDASSGDVQWQAGALELIDGGTRHVLNPASDGERLYSLVHGISSYRFEAASLQTGERLWSRELGPSPAGQDGLVTGAPVIGANGLIYVYIAYSRPPVTRVVGDIQEVVEEGEDFGWLIAFDAAGEERWRYEAPHDGFAQYREHATHLAGSDGAIYLATGRGVFALDADTAELRWERRDLSRLWTPRLALSPNGDLLVQFNDEQLAFIATDARGTADSPWPAPGGDRRNLNAR